MNILRPLLRRPTTAHLLRPPRPLYLLPSTTTTTSTTTPITTTLLHPRYVSLAPPRYPRDEEIPHTHVNFVDENGVFHGLHSLEALLHSIDRSTHHLICPNPDSPAPVIAKLVSKETLATQAANHILRVKQDRLKKKESKVVTKEAQISWAIDKHDLEYKMKRVIEVLDKGGKIEIHLGGKKGMTKVTLSQVEDLVHRIREEALTCSKEWKSPEGELGAQMVLFFEGIKGERENWVKWKENEQERIRLLEEQALLDSGVGEFASEGHPDVEEERKRQQEEFMERRARRERELAAREEAQRLKEERLKLEAEARAEQKRREEEEAAIRLQQQQQYPEEGMYQGHGQRQGHYPPPQYQGQYQDPRPHQQYPDHQREYRPQPHQQQYPQDYQRQQHPDHHQQQQPQYPQDHQGQYPDQTHNQPPHQDDYQRGYPQRQQQQQQNRPYQPRDQDPYRGRGRY